MGRKKNCAIITKQDDDRKKAVLNFMYTSVVFDAMCLRCVARFARLVCLKIDLNSPYCACTCRGILSLFARPLPVPTRLTNLPHTSRYSAEVPAYRVRGSLGGVRNQTDGYYAFFPSTRVGLLCANRQKPFGTWCFTRKDEPDEVVCDVFAGARDL